MQSTKLSEVMLYLKQSKDPKLNSAHEYFSTIFSSPYFGSYIALKAQMSRWDKEILSSKISIITTDDKDKSFERAAKYLTEMTFFIKSMEELEKKLLPEEIKEAAKQQSTEDLLSQALNS